MSKLVKEELGRINGIPKSGRVDGPMYQERVISRKDAAMTKTLLNLHQLYEKDLVLMNSILKRHRADLNFLKNAVTMMPSAERRTEIEKTIKIKELALTIVVARAHQERAVKFEQMIRAKELFDSPI